MKVIPLNDAVELTIEAAQGLGMSPDYEEAWRLLISSVQPIIVDDKEFYRTADLQGVIKNMLRACQSKDSSYIVQKRGLRVDRVVDIQEFCESAEFMNQKG